MDKNHRFHSCKRRFQVMMAKHSQVDDLFSFFSCFGHIEIWSGIIIKKIPKDFSKLKIMVKSHANEWGMLGDSTHSLWVHRGGGSQDSILQVNNKSSWRIVGERQLCTLPWTGIAVKFSNEKLSKSMNAKIR